MTKNVPPILPEKRLEKVLGVARFNAACVLVCSGAGLAVSGAGGDWVFAGFAALALVAGAMEWHGQERLREGDIGGVHWLLGAQACLYTVIAGYVLWRMRFFDGAQYWARIPDELREQFNAQMRQAGLDPEADRPLLLRTMNFMICVGLVIGGAIHQGGLSWWYRRQREAIATALGY